MLYEVITTQSFLKEGFVGSGRAGGNHYPVEILLFDNVYQLGLGVCGTREKILLGINHVGKSFGVICYFRNTYHAADVHVITSYSIHYTKLYDNVTAAVADKDPNTNIFGQFPTSVFSPRRARRAQRN